jgi:hypothetical protein
MGLLTPELFSSGYVLQEFALPASFAIFVHEENWNELDSAFKEMVASDGKFFQFLSRFHDFSSIEFIISVRDAHNNWEEDGIWHDDGTRVFAFSLSLTLAAEEIEGGKLEIRKKEDEQSALLASISTPTFGTAILFLTGVHGFEHRTRQVLKGKRVILAGWCS